MRRPKDPRTSTPASNAGREARAPQWRVATCVVLAGAFLLTVTVRAATLHYDAQVAWLRAGAVDLSVGRNGDRYELSGMVATSGAMNRFFRWQGRFAATGRFVDGYPVTNAYLLLEDDGETREVLLAFQDKTTIHATGRESEEVEQPPGSDLMSATFLAPHCLADGTIVHDGEDTYRVDLLSSSMSRLQGSPNDYSGPARRCAYRFYEDGRRARRITVWTAAVEGREVPVRIRIRVPVFPDGVLRLRLDR